MFHIKITGRMISEKGRPFKVGWVTIRGEEWMFGGFLPPYNAYLLATDFRLVVYKPEVRKVSQVLYEEIGSLSVQNDHFILRLRDGSEADLHMYIERPGVLSAAAMLGAPPAARPYALSYEVSRVRDAQSFVALFTEFFTEIIEENKRRQR